MNRYGQANRSIEAVLFGSVLGVKMGDIVAVSIVAVVALRSWWATDDYFFHFRP